MKMAIRNPWLVPLFLSHATWLLEKELSTHSNILTWEFCGQKSLVGYSPWGHKELDMTEWLSHTHTHTQSIFIYLFGCAGFPGGSDGKASACSAEDRVLIPGLERSPGEGNDNPLQYSCLENPMDGGAWYNPCGLYGHKESDTTEWLHFHCLFTWLLVFFHFVLYLFSFFYDLLEMVLIEHLRDKE